MKRNKDIKLNIDFSKNFAVAVCLRPFEDFSEQADYSALILKKLEIFDNLAESFQKAGFGTEYDRNADEIRLICVFPLESREIFADKYIKPVLAECECSVICGIGLISANHLHLDESLQTSKEACDLSFFEDGNFFEYQKIKRPYSVSMDEYESLSEKAFKAILAKNPSAIDNISDCLDLIRKIHYGNKQAVIMRAMNYTGEMAYRLHRYDMLGRDFYEMQDALQEKVLSSENFAQVKEIILDYYHSLISDINSQSRTGRRTMIEQVKKYIQENYMEDLKAEDLASIACVSKGYFSHMFKNETGQGFKSFLTDVRMKAATELLLSSDLRLYEISENVGYKNIRNFTEAFTLKYGISPTEYKKAFYKS